MKPLSAGSPWLVLCGGEGLQRMRGQNDQYMLLFSQL